MQISQIPCRICYASMRGGNLGQTSLSELSDSIPPLAILARSSRFPLQAFELIRFFASFQPGGQIREMNAPATVSGVVVAIPVLTFANARVDEVETRAIVFRCQFKGNRGNAWLCFPGIAEAMGWFENEDLAKVEHTPCTLPLEPDRASRAQIDLGFRQKPAFKIFFLCQGLEEAFRSGFDEQFFLN